MKLFADLHLHSKYSRAVSEKMNALELARAGKVKGLNLLGTGDFTHPLYLKELKETLKPSQHAGMYEAGGSLFLLTAEVSQIFTQDGRGRRVHNILFAPSFEVVDQLNEGFDKWGKRDYDGRPIFGRSCIELADLCRSISPDIEIIPAHCWTPWFAIFGSMSGFDSIKECFGDRASMVHAIETGMSSDPAMNWRLSQLDDITLVSFSDAHSPYPWKLGREATIFDLDKPSYNELIDSIRKKDPKRLLSTIETQPEYGKYHWDGHRACNFSCDPEESKRLHDVCPVCKRRMTIGVEHRVNQLADRPAGFVPEGSIPFKALIPLSEVIAGVLDTGIMSKSVWREFDSLMRACGNELNALLEAPYEKLAGATHEKIAKAIIDNREGRVRVKPGYDGVYGVPIFGEKEKVSIAIEPAERSRLGQQTLGEY
ncbi:DNA helicase UvrD [Candidatus Micrarchaeota archaeon]|nr:DNA helicase UvrD [Candidatus Micrarchaeota archaeon]